MYFKCIFFRIRNKPIGLEVKKATKEPSGSLSTKWSRSNCWAKSGERGFSCPWPLCVCEKRGHRKVTSKSEREIPNLKIFKEKWKIFCCWAGAGQAESPGCPGRWTRHLHPATQQHGRPGRHQQWQVSRNQLAPFSEYTTFSLSSNVFCCRY